MQHTKRFLIFFFFFRLAILEKRLYYYFIITTTTRAQLDYIIGITYTIRVITMIYDGNFNDNYYYIFTDKDRTDVPIIRIL